MVEAFLIFSAFFIGLATGVVITKGITININQTPTFTEDEYNDSVGTDDPETRQYSEQTGGIHKF
jgi:hypothetical protein